MYSTPASVGHADQPQARLDISSLERDVQRYFEHGLAASTKRTYQAGIINFCAMYSISHPLPVSQAVLCLFISHLANLGLANATIKTYLAAIRHLHISMDLPEPRSTPIPELALVERGIRRVKSSERSTRNRLPSLPRSRDNSGHCGRGRPQSRVY